MIACRQFFCFLLDVLSNDFLSQAVLLPVDDAQVGHTETLVFEQRVACTYTDGEFAIADDTIRTLCIKVSLYLVSKQFLCSGWCGTFVQGIVDGCRELVEIGFRTATCGESVKSQFVDTILQSAYRLCCIEVCTSLCECHGHEGGSFP